MLARGAHVLPAQSAGGALHLLGRPAQLVAGGPARPRRLVAGRPARPRRLGAGGPARSRRLGAAPGPAELLGQGLELGPQRLLFPSQPFQLPPPLFIRSRLRGLTQVPIDPLLSPGELLQAGERLVVVLDGRRLPGLTAGLVAGLLLAPQLPIEERREVLLGLIARRPRARLHRDLPAPDGRLGGQQLVQRLGLVRQGRYRVQRRERRLGRGHRLDRRAHRPALVRRAGGAGRTAPAAPGHLPDRARRRVAHVALHLGHRPHVVRGPARRLLLEPPRGHDDLLLQRRQPADLGRLRPQTAAAQCFLELVVEGPDLQEVQVGARLGRHAALTRVAHPREIGDDVSRLDPEVLDEERADPGHPRRPRGNVERQRPIGPTRDRIDQVQAIDGVIVVGLHLDGDLFERGNLPVAAGAHHPHRRRAVGRGANDVVGRVPVRQSMGVDDPHRIPAVPVDHQRRGATAVPGLRQRDPPAAGQQQRPVRDRLVGMHHQSRGGAGRGEEIAAVLLDPGSEAGERRIRVLDVDPRHPRRRQRLDPIVPSGERGGGDPVPEAAGHRRELREIAILRRSHANLAGGHAVEHRQDGRSPGRHAAVAGESGADAEGLAGHETDVPGLHPDLHAGRQRMQPGGPRDPAQGSEPEGQHGGERRHGQQPPRGGAPHPRRRDNTGEVDPAETLGRIGDHQLVKAGGGPRRRERGSAGHPIFQLGTPLLDEPRHPLVRWRPPQRPQHARAETEGRQQRGARRHQQGHVRRREKQLDGDDRQHADAGAPRHAGQTVQPPGGQPTPPDPGQGDSELGRTVSHGAIVSPVRGGGNRPWSGSPSLPCAAKGAIPQRVRIPPGNCRSSR